MDTQAEKMKLHLNGDERVFPDAPASFTLAALAETLGMKVDRVAIELNHDIVPRDRWAETVLKEGDRLEIVHFVGGGTGATSAHPCQELS
jgi:thiamine biosynthesis protein ThiS